MTSLGYIALYGWPFVVVPVLFFLLPARLAVFVGVIFGWLFLPFGRVDVAGPIELNKFGACTLTVILCAVLLDSARVARFRFHLVDLPMFMWVIASPISSLTNGLGTTDAASAVFHQLVTWGIPYFLGRVYITDAASLKELALVVFFAGIAYTPLVVWEARMSPRLHAQLYGFVTYSYGGLTTRRFNGWRPVVFQQHGLMLGLLMASTAMVGAWLWWTGTWRRFRPMALFHRKHQERWGSWSGIARRMPGAPKEVTGLVLPTLPLVVGLVMVAVMCRALNALLLMCVVAGALVALRNPIWKTRLGLVCVLLIPLVYMGSRLAPNVIGISIDQPIIELARAIDPDRAGSMQFRVESEQMLAEHALQQPVFGWGGWGRNRVHNEQGEDISVTDGLWIIILGVNGLFGLTAWYLAMTGPIWLLVLRYPARVLASAEAAPAMALSVIILMFVMDCLPNAMITVIQPLAIGGLAGLLVAQGSRAGRPSVARARDPIGRGGGYRGVPVGAGA